MLYRHVFDKISTEFRGIFCVFVSFADLPEFHIAAIARNIKSPEIWKNFAICELMMSVV